MIQVVDLARTKWQRPSFPGRWLYAVRDVELSIL
jgi:hypothetical protein